MKTLDISILYEDEMTGQLFLDFSDPNVVNVETRGTNKNLCSISISKPYEESNK